jgi:hypothetical protein
MQNALATDIRSALPLPPIRDKLVCKFQSIVWTSQASQHPTATGRLGNAHNNRALRRAEAKEGPTDEPRSNLDDMAIVFGRCLGPSRAYRILNQH